MICAGSFISGATLVIAADKIASGSGVYTVVWIGMLLAGIGWGCSEAVINPLTTRLYPDSPAMGAAKTVATVKSLRFVAALPAVLLIVFGAIWLKDRASGGFKPEKI